MELIEKIGELFRYPDDGFLEKVQQTGRILRNKSPLSGAEFLAVEEYFTKMSVQEQEEFYIRTFDVHASCHLDIGYVIFGDEAKRGQFLYHMKEEQQKAENDCGKELADFLPNVLTLLPKISDQLFREELVVSILLPALKKMKEQLENDRNIYSIPMNILIHLLEEKFSDSEFEVVVIGKKDQPGFLSNYITGIDTSLLSKKQFNRKYNEF